MSDLIPRKHCAGCRDDFYNGPRGENGRCWMAADAEMKTRYRTHRDARPDEHGAFERVDVPNCYHGAPWYYTDTLPDFVPLSAVIDRRAS